MLGEGPTYDGRSVSWGTVLRVFYAPAFEGGSVAKILRPHIDGQSRRCGGQFRAGISLAFDLLLIDEGKFLEQLFFARVDPFSCFVQASKRAFAIEAQASAVVSDTFTRRFALEVQIEALAIVAVKIRHKVHIPVVVDAHDVILGVDGHGDRKSVV